jgi:dihydropteroate synthase
MIKIMGVINVSPESFYKGSVKVDAKEIEHAVRAMEEQGASIIDIGAMSTAPYLNTLVSVEQEVERIKHAVRVAKDSISKAIISVDTPRAEVAKVALSIGAEMVNDVTGLKYDPLMAMVIKDFNAYAILSAYSRSTVRGDAIAKTLELLKESIDIAYSNGIDEDKIIVDPAIGFFREHGKHEFFTRIDGMGWFERDLEVIRRLRELKALGKDICVSVSRKSFIGKILGIDKPEDRLIGSLAVEAICIMNGADIIRTHDVKESMQVARIVEAIISNSRLG